MLCLQHDLYNINFKIKCKLYIASGSASPPPLKRKNSGCAPGIHNPSHCNHHYLTYKHTSDSSDSVNCVYAAVFWSCVAFWKDADYWAAPISARWPDIYILKRSLLSEGLCIVQQRTPWSPHIGTAGCGDSSKCRPGCTGRCQHRWGVTRVSNMTEVRELRRHSVVGRLQWHLAWEANSYPPGQENRNEQKALSLVRRLRKIKLKASFCQFVRMKQLVSCWMNFYYKLRQHFLFVTWSCGGYFKNSCCTLTNYNVCRIRRLLINTGKNFFGIDFVTSVPFTDEANFGTFAIKMP
jgi:hypothetical protein